MKRFEVEVVKKDSYIIEIDETKINEQWMEEYRKYFSDIYTLQKHAENIAQQRSRFGNTFIEGYGIPLIDGQCPLLIPDEYEVEKGINIRIISEDEEVDVVSYEI